MDKLAIIFFLFRCVNFALLCFFAYHIFRRALYPAFKKEIENEIAETNRLSHAITDAGQESVQLQQSIEQQADEAQRLMEKMRSWQTWARLQQQTFAQQAAQRVQALNQRAALQAIAYHEQEILCATLPRVLRQVRHQLVREFSPGSAGARTFMDELVKDLAQAGKGVDLHGSKTN